MDNKQFNEERYNRQKQKYRFFLGIQQLVNHRFLNVIWILFAVGVSFMAKIEKKYIANIEVYPMFQSTFSVCMKVIMIIFPVICAVGLVQFIGYCFAVKDEGRIYKIFCDNKNNRYEAPILTKKKVTNEVTIREFYTTIPMKEWQDRENDICDVFNCRIQGSIEYGGKNNRTGYLRTLKSVNERKGKGKVFYDRDMEAEMEKYR